MAPADQETYVDPQENHLGVRDELRESLEAMQTLICDMLRSSHFHMLSKDEMRIYIYQVGVALHNIPINIANRQILYTSQLSDIDRLDPSSTKYKWGEWVSRYASKTNQVLPEKKSIPATNTHLHYKTRDGEGEIPTHNNFYIRLSIYFRNSLNKIFNRT